MQLLAQPLERMHAPREHSAHAAQVWGLYIVSKGLWSREAAVGARGGVEFLSRGQTSGSLRYVCVHAAVGRQLECE